MNKLLTVIVIFSACAVCMADPVYVKNPDGSISEVVPIDPTQVKADLQAEIDQDVRQIVLVQKMIVNLQNDIATTQKKMDSLTLVVPVKDTSPVPEEDVQP